MRINLFLTIFCFYGIAFGNMPLIYFNQYSENKNAFLKLSNNINLSDWNTRKIQWSFNSDPNLTTDLLFLKKNKSTKNLLVLSSGLHGIEGYVGSAIQRWFVETYLKNTNINYDILLIHSLNPWGMQNKRRVNENNVDLNRNFLATEAEYSTENKSYMSIDSFLNPQNPVEITFFSRALFIYDSIKLILQYSTETLRKSILIGQYQQPRGIFFGGSHAENLKEKIDDLVKKDLQSYKNTIWIDLHTGYGKNGKLHLLANDSQSENGKRLSSLFTNTQIDYGEDRKFYKTSGDLANYVSNLSHNENTITSVVFEYGTLNSQSTLGSIESLRRMVIENQGYQNKFTDNETRIASNQLFKEMFFPEDTEWTQNAVLQTESALSHVIFN